MDPEAPKPEESGDRASKPVESARKRADSLEGGKKPGETSRKSDDKSASPRPRLTEKQRIEARRNRQNRRRKPVKGNPLSKGMRAVGFEIQRTASFLGSSVIAGLAALGPVFSAAGMGLVWLIEQAGLGLKALVRLVRRTLAACGRLIIAVDRVVTPLRALVLVAAFAAVLLGISQYKGLGAIEIGQPGYAGIEDLARAPAIDRTTPAGVHTRIFVPIAAIALAAVLVVALGSLKSFTSRLSRFRRLAAMVLITIGLLTLVVSLTIDLPQATDTTEAALAYAEVQARLLSGFWLQLAAGASLTAAGIAFLLEPVTRPVRRKRREDRPARTADTSIGGTRVINGGSA